MRIEQEPFYYFSGEYYSPVFPVRCFFVRWLKVVNSTTRAMIVRADVPFGIGKQLTEFVLLPRWDKSLDDLQDQEIFSVFVFAVDDRVQGDTLDLSEGLKHVQDWASICFSHEFAASQVSTMRESQIIGESRPLPTTTRPR